MERAYINEVQKEIGSTVKVQGLSLIHISEPTRH